MDGVESWSIKEADRKRINSFELRCYKRLLRIPWTARRTNSLVIEEIELSIKLPTTHSLQYYVYLNRRQGNNFKKLVVQGKMQRRKDRDPRARSSTIWVIKSRKNYSCY